MSAPTRPTHRCGFCGKAQARVRRLIAGADRVYICNECVRVCQEILDAEGRTAAQRDEQAPPA